MHILKLQQTTSDGRTKTWKFNSSEKLFTFGTSRKADVLSIDDRVESFESALEYRNSEWHYITFSTKCSSKDKTANNHKADTIIKGATLIKLSNSSLKFEIISKELDLLKNIEAGQYTDNSANQQPQQKEQELLQKNVQQLILVIKNNQIINIQTHDPAKKFQIYSNGQLQKISLPLSDSWCTQDLSDYTIKYKKIKAADLTAYKDISHNQFIDKESKTALITTLTITFLLIVVSLLVPNPEVVAPVVKSQTSTSVVVKTNLKQKIKKEKQVSNAARPEPIKNNNSGATAGGKVSALIKGSLGVRISQLLGKVSSTEARTANVLVTTVGIKAGEGAAGRGLAALGKVESSGRNWTGEAKGAGSGVSTVGIGGGGNSNKLGGGLGQGKTGAGGVGLIEEESEIVGGLDREVIAQYIKTQLGQILYCYERQLSANPNLYGKIAVKFTIAGTGQVETQSINDTTLKNVSVESCILNKISKWKFPEPKGGTKVLVTYPFLFKSTI